MKRNIIGLATMFMMLTLCCCKEDTTVLPIATPQMKWIITDAIVTDSYNKAFSLPDEKRDIQFTYSETNMPSFIHSTLYANDVDIKIHSNIHKIESNITMRAGTSSTKYDVSCRIESQNNYQRIDSWKIYTVDKETVKAEGKINYCPMGYFINSKFTLLENNPIEVEQVIDWDKKDNMIGISEKNNNEIHVTFNDLHLNPQLNININKLFDATGIYRNAGLADPNLSLIGCFLELTGKRSQNLIQSITQGTITYTYQYEMSKDNLPERIIITQTNSESSNDINWERREIVVNYKHYGCGCNVQYSGTSLKKE